MTANATWQSDVADPSSINVEKAGFLLEQAKEVLRETHSTAAILDRKITTLLGFFISIQTGLIGYLIFLQDWELRTAVGTMAGIFFVSSYRLYDAMAPKPYWPLGNEPKNLYVQQVCVQDTALIIQMELQGYQNRIVVNQVFNKKKADILSNASLWAIVSPIISGIAVLIVMFVRHLTI
jgi:hypothetical protein